MTTKTKKPETLVQRLLKFQGMVSAIEKDQTNPHFRNQYFDINSVLEEVMPKLTECGILMLQPPGTQEGVAGIHTMLINADNVEDRIDFFFPMPVDNNPQKFGSSLTYFRRYCAVSTLCLQGEVCDDANLASGQGIVKKISEKQIGLIQAKRSKEEITKTLRALRCNSLQEVTAKDASQWISKIMGS